MEGSSLGGITKFFITNLPEGCTPWELKCGLAGLGDVWGTYVAKKRDKEGRRFGFASFKDVRDKSELERSLKGIKLGGCKLVVNIARFAKENGGGGAPVGPPKDPEFSNHRPFPQGDARTFNCRDGRSYSDVLGKGKGVESGLGGGSSFAVLSSVGRKSIVIPDRSMAFKDLWRKAVVARTMNLETLVDLDHLLRIAKSEVVSIQYLGGLSVLISFCDEGLASSFLESKELWGPWFSKVAMWEGQSLPFERVAWLRFLGVPLHLVDPEVLRMIGESFGKFLHVQKSFCEEKDLSVVRVGVLVGDVERVKEFVSIKWKNRSFRIWVEEELDVWVPDCLKGVAGENPTTSSPMMSSQFGDQAGPGKHGEGDAEVEGVCMGNNSNDDNSGAGPNEVNFDWQPFLESCAGKVPNQSEKVNAGIHYFQASKKTKRLRKGGPKSYKEVSGGSPSLGLDSLDRGRPKKRNRPPVEESSDPFSLDSLIYNLNNNNGSEGVGSSPIQCFGPYSR
ncbi:putative RNA recognition motif domain, nucleotide-binding alpha-beta plait domain superfamily [Helianthus annuus]|nr:putative RNA recognition motif domain, nucleotide-binding alpha-beta plait domain superfamily [Helianthus annuus]KAJ0760220.1 putative RNA recognition motif domain, nucleotide-binding alpha-beta plait domain superfamily [Helianthus annuus]KAJ0930004.1 putative RNA recognition motif domain, nucleotide-binding alpha-beta plait domain superfamily [Helianthus annuus]